MDTSEQNIKNEYMVIDSMNREICKIHCGILRNGTNNLAIIDDVNVIPSDLRKLWNDYEAYVNDQIFSLTEEIEDKIDKLNLRLKDQPYRMIDVQVMNGDQMSFGLKDDNVLETKV